MRKQIFLPLLMGLLLSGLFIIQPLEVHAVCPPDCGSLTTQTTPPSTTSSPDIVRLDNPLGTDVSIPELIGRVIKAILGIVGSLALVMFIYGGFTWMLAAGNSEKVKKGKDILVWAAIGLVMIFSSYALVRFVIESIGNA